MVNGLLGLGKGGGKEDMTAGLVARNNTLERVGKRSEANRTNGQKKLLR